MAAAAGASAKALEIVLREPELRSRLAANAARLRDGTAAVGPYVRRLAGPDHRPAHGQQREHVPHSPGVAHGGHHRAVFRRLCRFRRGRTAGRIAVFATHTEEMLDRLLAHLARLV